MDAKMKKKFRFRVQSQCESFGEIKARQLLPNEFVQAVGPFVFLKHILSCKQSSNESHAQSGGKCSYPHPHRGIATITYILSGEVEHTDSIGYHTKLSSGGLHWMKAGKGIIHAETVRPEYRLASPDVSIVQFWINLTAKDKTGEPDYFSIPSDQIPKQKLDDEAGWLKVLSGEHRGMTAGVPNYSKEFLYHLQLESGKKFSTKTSVTVEYAAFLPANTAIVNDTEFQAGELIVFTWLGEIIEIMNDSEMPIDIILFGGERYNEPIVAEGTFVMNTPHEITQAFNDYNDGKYGELTLK